MYNIDLIRVLVFGKICEISLRYFILTFSTHVLLNFINLYHKFYFILLLSFFILRLKRYRR